MVRLPLIGFLFFTAIMFTMESIGDYNFTWLNMLGGYLLVTIFYNIISREKKNG